MELEKAFQEIAKEIELTLRSQAPSEKLKSAIQVSYERVNDEDNFVINYDSDNYMYGIYLHRGTKEERDPEASDDFQEMAEAFVQRRPNNNPGRGKGGIKPRYWLTLTQIDIERYQQEIEQAIDQALQEVIEKETA